MGGFFLNFTGNIKFRQLVPLKKFSLYSYVSGNLYCELYVDFTKLMEKYFDKM